MAMRRHHEACATPSESLGKPPFRSRMRPVGGVEKVLTMRRIACTFPPTRRAAYAISMSHDHRFLVLQERGGRWRYGVSHAPVVCDNGVVGMSWPVGRGAP